VIQLTDTVKRRMPIVFALLMGTVAVMLMRQYLAQQRRLLEEERRRLYADYREPIEVVVASKDLKENVALEASHLTTATVPEKFTQPYAVRSPRDILGMVTVAPIAKGEQVLLNKVRRPEAVPAGAILSSITPEGKRAVTIGVDAVTGVGGFVRPGDKVDILWTVKLPQTDSMQGQLLMLTLFQDVDVLAVGGQLAGQKGQKAEAAEGTRDFTVTLALDPQEISFLLFAREQGRIQLSLRPKGEPDSKRVVAPANINTLLEAKLGLTSPPPPPPPAPPVRPVEVEVYKGLKRDVVELPAEE
jgi:pilus assembly protein CpaB